MITEEQAKILTTSRFWQCEIGEAHKIKIKDWGYEETDNFKRDAKIPALICTVVEEDDKPLIPIKRWEIKSMAVRKQIIDTLLQAQANNINSVTLFVQRSDKQHYQIIDIAKIKFTA